MSFDYLSTSRQKQRHAQRQSDVNRLKELGWKEFLPGLWTCPPSKHSYSVGDAIALEILRSNILRSGANKGLRNNGRRGNANGKRKGGKFA